MMRVRTLAILAVISTASLANVAKAQDIEFASQTELLGRIQQLEGELTQLRQAQYSSGYTELSQSCCDSCGSSCCDGYCSVERGIYAGADAVIAKPFFENGVQNDDDEASFDYKFSPRFWLGIRNHAGFGVRGRYWWFDADSETPSNNPDARSNLNVQVADIEGTRSVCWGPMTADFFVGARWATIDYVRISDDVGTATRGIGPSIGADTRIPLGNGGLSAVGNVRGAALFGDVRADTNQSDKTMYSGELQLGLEYQRCLGSGVISIHALSEAQVWMAGTTSPSGLGGTSPDEDLGFFGVTLGGQFRY